jgi:hypothetical protein
MPRPGRHLRQARVRCGTRLAIRRSGRRQQEVPHDRVLNTGGGPVSQDDCSDRRTLRRVTIQAGGADGCGYELLVHCLFRAPDRGASCDEILTEQCPYVQRSWNAARPPLLGRIERREATHPQPQDCDPLAQCVGL